MFFSVFRGPCDVQPILRKPRYAIRIYSMAATAAILYIVRTVIRAGHYQILPNFIYLYLLVYFIYPILFVAPILCLCYLPIQCCVILE